MRAALEHAEKNPLAFPAASWSRSLDELRHAVAKAFDDASRAEALKLQAHEALKTAKLARAEADEPLKTAEADAALADFVKTVNAMSAQIAPALALVSEKLAQRDALRLELSGAGKPFGRDAGTSLASYWPGLLDRRGPLWTAANVAHWSSHEETLRREGDESERLRRLEATKVRAALDGLLGPDEQEKARLQFRKFYPGKSALVTGAQGTRAELELSILRKNAGLDA
jgi:hypothetical protein